MRTVGTLFLLGLGMFGVVSEAVSQEPVDVILDLADQGSQMEGDAIILTDRMVVTVSEDGSRESVITQRILLHSWDAIDFYGKSAWTYYSEQEEITLLYARTILPSGDVVTPDASSIYETSYSEPGMADAYSSIKTLGVLMPALQPGSVIDCAILVKEEAPLIPGGFFEWWTFSWDDPVLCSELILDLPADLDVDWFVHRTDLVPEIQTQPGRIRVSFRVENLPSFAYEPWSPSPDVLSPQVSVSSLDSWSEIATWWAGVIDGKAEADEAIERQAVLLTEGLASEREKIHAISRFVSREIRYVALALGASGFEPRPAAETFQTRFGDCKDQVILMMAMLNTVGIESHPLLVETAAGSVLGPTWPPTPYAFDHVVLAAEDSEGGWELYDPTCPYCVPGYRHEMIRARSGLLVLGLESEPGTMIEIAHPDPLETYETCRMTAVLDEEGMLTGSASLEAAGEFALWYRSIMSYYRPFEREDAYYDLLQWVIPKARVTDFRCPDPDEVFTPWEMSASIEKTRFSRSIGGGMIMLPLPYVPTLSDPGAMIESIETSGRVHPLLITPGRCLQTVRIAVPDGYVIELPDNQWVENAIGSFRATYDVVGQEIVYERELLLQTDSVSPDDYPAYEELILAMLDDAEATAILK